LECGLSVALLCSSLEELWVFNPPDADLTRFAALESLRRFELSGGRKLEQTAGIEQLHRLTFLGLYLQPSLRELTGVDELSSLLDLALENCKNLESIDEVSALTGLRTLKLADCGDIPSLQPLTNLSSLERFFAWGSTRITDGDLSILMRLPRLREIAMRSRRAYRPSVEDVELALSPAQRPPGGQ
jgi:internalin A